MPAAHRSLVETRGRFASVPRPGLIVDRLCAQGCGSLHPGRKPTPLRGSTAVGDGVRLAAKGERFPRRDLQDTARSVDAKWSPLLPFGLVFTKVRSEVTLRLGIAVLLDTALLGTGLLFAGSAPKAEYRDSERKHWSLLQRTHPEVPAYSQKAGALWATNSDAPANLRDSVGAIDAFVLSRLEKEGLQAAAPAGRRTLIRRLYFDLIGLPPSPAEVADFLADKSPGAYPKLVEHLLGSPHYGERRALHWLDVVRFAESEGFEYDRHMPGAWRFRDYVIQSFNNDKPYDQFVREQLAGDEIDPDKNEYKIAAGFHRLGAVRRNAGNQEVSSSRNEVLTERTDIIGASFLGLTVGCARCHDHMFDAIRQKDYYRLQAFLAATQEHNLILATEERQADWKARTDEINAKVKALKEAVKKLPTDERQPTYDEVLRLEAALPGPLPTICSIQNDDEKRTEIHVLERGNYDSKGEAVGIRALGVLLPEGAPGLPPETSAPRTKLAEWITDPDHPLTARVMVNRIWQSHFGQGIVRTANDFGFNGDRPSHPELLDFLANEFVESGWSVKHMHRLIVLSHSYRQSSRSAHEGAGIAKDPENRFFWRYSRRRLQAEEIRDAMLAVSGRLNTKRGGKSILVPVEEGLVNLLYKPSQWKVAADTREHERRSVYLMAKRNLRVPFMEVFDQPTLQTSCYRRESSTHAPQALELLNGDLSNNLAVAFAERLRKEVGSNQVQQVERAYLLAAGRDATDKELELGVEFLKEQPLREFALAMFNLNSFLYVN